MHNLSKTAVSYEYASFRLTLKNIQRHNDTLGWTLGEDSSKSSTIDILTSFLGIHGTESVHAFFQLHCSSGSLTLTAASDDTTISVLEGIEWKQLPQNSLRVLLDRTTLIRIHSMVFKVVRPVYNVTDYAHHIERRNHEFMCAGIPVPDPRLYSVPKEVPFLMIGQFIRQGCIGEGRFGWVEIGIDSHTGEPVAIKEIGVGDHTRMSHLKQELEILLSFPVSLQLVLSVLVD